MAEKYGAWVVERPLSRGGQSVTYIVLSEDNASGERFVLKRLVNVNRLDRAEREIRAGSEVEHPNVLRVVEWDLAARAPYIVSEYCEGGSLADLEIGELTTLETLRIFSGICHGLGAAHERGVIHRDVKPDNVFLRADKRTPVVGDFGLCFIDDDSARVTTLDEVVGPRWFIAPEVEMGRVDEVSARSDVYSLGKLLYWMLTTRRLPREDYREPEFDILAIDRSPATYFIYDLFDKMLIRDASRRMSDARMVSMEVDEIIRRIEINAHPIGKGKAQLCMYCGIGEYIVLIANYQKEYHRSNLYNDGWDFMNAPGPPPWRVTACDYCGNVQIFRPDKADDSLIWERP